MSGPYKKDLQTKRTIAIQRYLYLHPLKSITKLKIRMLKFDIF